MNTLKEIDEQMLLSYYSDILSPEQRQEVEAWIAQSEQQAKLAREVQYLFLATDTLQTIQRANAQEALQQVKGKIKRRRYLNHLIWVQRVAALLFIPLLVTALYMYSKKETARMVEYRTNPGMVTIVDLPDGSKVWLNSGSTLKHPQHFTGNTRTVDIDGEAYFSVKKSHDKPFCVNTPFELQVEVLGTEFNIDAYKKNNYATTSLSSGAVKLLYQTEGAHEKSVLMKPNEEVKYSSKTKSIAISTANLATLTAWKDGLVVFRNTSFEEALSILGKRFNTDFVVKNNHLYDNSYTGTFSGQHLSLILEHFRLSSGIEYKYVDPVVKASNQQVALKSVVELY